MIANLAVGEVARFTKTVGESDVYLFGGIIGDLSPNHVDEEYGRKTRYGGRIAHGMLVLSLASATSPMLQARAGQAPGAVLITMVPARKNMHQVVHSQPSWAKQVELLRFTQKFHTWAMVR